MSLAEELNKTVEVVKANVPGEIFNAIGQSIADLDATGIADRAANVGTPVKLPTLPDLNGKLLDLHAIAQKQPLVLIFYRGGWCPYCNVALQAYSRRIDHFKAKNAQIVAITPELESHAAETSGKSNLAFPVLIDKGNRFARELGLVFSLPIALRPQYRQIGIDLESWNGDNTHELPVPATYIVGSDSKIRWAFVDANFTKRADPDDILAGLAN